jgi:hypothetical protein
MRKTHKQQILELLRQRGNKGAFTSELKEIGNQYTARISELTSVGYIIDAYKVTDGEWKYVLTYEPPQEEAKLKAEELLKKTLTEFGHDADEILEIIDAYGLIVKYQNGKVKEYANSRRNKSQD